MMELLSRFLKKDVCFQIDGHAVFLRTPQMDDFQNWAHVRDESRSFLTPWEPRWSMDELSRHAFRRRIRQCQAELERDEAYPFFLFRASDTALLGGLTFGNVRRGAARAATLGYWMSERHAGQGYMSQGLRLALSFAFTRLDLRRIEAACLPENYASLHLLQATGFQQEGRAREYLNIDGRWSDHLLFALLASDSGLSANSSPDRMV